LWKLLGLGLGLLYLAGAGLNRELFGIWMGNTSNNK
jgi:hypothetical protein